MTQTKTAVILAAGRGSRLGNLTAAAPKCLVELGGRALLEWQVDALRGCGVERIVVVSGYLAEQLEGFAVERIHNPDWACTQMVASLLCAREVLKEGPVVVSYADIVFGHDVVRRLQAAEGHLAFTYDLHWLALWSERFDDPLADAESFSLDREGRVTHIGTRPSSISEIEGQYMGLLRMDPVALGWIDAFLSAQADPDCWRKIDMTSLLNGLIGAGRRIDAVPVRGGWCEVDDPRDLAVARAWLADGRLVLGGAR